MLVKFINGYSPYQKGEIAGFNPDMVQKLVQMGVAKKYVNETQTEEAPKKEAPVVIAIEQAPANRMIKKAKNK